MRKEQDFTIVLPKAGSLVALLDRDIQSYKSL